MQDFREGQFLRLQMVAARKDKTLFINNSKVTPPTLANQSTPIQAADVLAEMDNPKRGTELLALGRMMAADADVQDKLQKFVQNFLLDLPSTTVSGQAVQDNFPISIVA